MGSIGRADSVLGGEMAMNDENPYQSPESAPEREKRQSIGTVSGILVGLILGLVYAAVLFVISAVQTLWLRALLTSGCVLTGALASVLIRDIAQRHLRQRR